MLLSCGLSSASRYHEDMARGWESKSVEEQQADQPQPGGASEKHAAAVASADRNRQRQALELQRERILDERTSNPHRRQALEAALNEIEAKLSQM